MTKQDQIVAQILLAQAKGIVTALRDVAPDTIGLWLASAQRFEDEAARVTSTVADWEAAQARAPMPTVGAPKL